MEQLRTILAIAQEPWRTLYSILSLDGLRAGEALGVQWQDIDLDRKLMHIRRSAWYGQVQTTKSQTSETVLPIPDALVTILKGYRAQWQANPRIPSHACVASSRLRGYAEGRATADPPFRRPHDA